MEPKYYAFWRWLDIPIIWEYDYAQGVGFLQELQYSTPWKIYMEPTKARI